MCVGRGVWDGGPGCHTESFHKYRCKSVQFGAFLVVTATENVQLMCLIYILGDQFGGITSSKVARKIDAFWCHNMSLPCKFCGPWYDIVYWSAVMQKLPHSVFCFNAENDSTCDI